MKGISNEELRQRGYNIVLWKGKNNRAMSSQEVNDLCEYMDKCTGVAGVYLSTKIDPEECDYFCTDVPKLLQVIKKYFPDTPALCYDGTRWENIPDEKLADTAPA